VIGDWSFPPFVIGPATGALLCRVIGKSAYLSLLTSHFSLLTRSALVLPFGKFFGGLGLFVHTFLGYHPFGYGLAFDHLLDDVK